MSVMRKNLSMLLIALSLVLLPMGQGHAQDAADNADATQVGGQAAASDAAAVEDASADAEPQEPNAQDIAQVDEEQTDANGRFIPTEQLSQDLGASFPVDI